MALISELFWLTKTCVLDLDKLPQPSCTTPVELPPFDLELLPGFGPSSSADFLKVFSACFLSLEKIVTSAMADDRTSSVTVEANRSVEGEQSDQSDGPSMSYLFSPPQPEPASPWRCGPRTMRVMLSLLAGAVTVSFLLALGAYIWNHPQQFGYTTCSHRRPDPEFGFVCCDAYNNTNGCPLQPWAPTPAINLSTVTHPSDATEPYKRDLQAVTVDLAAFDSEFIHIDLESRNAESVDVGVQTTTARGFIQFDTAENTVTAEATSTPFAVTTTAESMIIAEPTPAHLDVRTNDESTTIAEATPTPFAVPAPYTNPQHAMSDLEFVRKHKGPTTTTNGFRSPSTTLMTFTTSTRSATTFKATSLSSASTLATIDDVTAQATRLLHTQQLMSGYQSLHHDLMKGYIQNLNEALDIGDAEGAMEVMANMFEKMGKYEIFLEGVVIGLELDTK